MIDYRNRMMDFRPRIVVIEPLDSLREGFGLILFRNKAYNLVNTYSNAADAIRNLSKDLPDIIYTDVDIPNEGGVEVIRKIRRHDSKVHIIVLSYNEDLETILSAFAGGASGYLSKSSNPIEILDSVAEIFNNGALMSPRIAKLVISSFQRSPNSPLSNRETEILSSLATGKTYKITANELHIGMETVKSHVKNIYSKLHVSTKSEAIELARQQSLI